MPNECTSDLLHLLQLANGTVLHFNYELILYYCGYSYYIFYKLKILKKASAEILELGLKTGEALASPASLLPMGLLL